MINFLVGLHVKMPNSGFFLFYLIGRKRIELLELLFLARTLGLHLKTLTHKKGVHLLTFGKVMRHVILFVHHILVLFGMLLV